MDLTELAQAVVDIFAPDTESYGSYPVELKPSEIKNGKLENPKKGVTFSEKWGIEKIVDHLSGKGPRFGVVPVSSLLGTIKFMACDIDIYDGSIKHGELAQRLFNIHPMLFLLRSKSGAAHVYAFFKEPVIARPVRVKMKEIIGTLGFGDGHEYFPKQDRIDVANKEFGNWINLPYFDYEKPTQYAYNPATGEALTLEEFIGHVQVRAGTLADFEEIKPCPQKDAVTDGPPCLQYIFSSGLSVKRNIALSNLTVYLKKKYPEDWFNRLDEYNRMFSEPLYASEVSSITNSHRKKSYSYQCREEPLSSYCNKAACNLRKYGINSGEALPFIESITKHNSDPPIWWIYFDDGQKMRCSTEDLQNTRGFQRRCMDQLNIAPAILKQDQWTRILQELLKNITIIEVDESATALGILKHYILDYFVYNPNGETYEELLNKKPVLIGDEYCFALIHLLEWLSKKSYNLAKSDLVSLVLEQMGASRRIVTFKDNKGDSLTRSIMVLPASAIKQFKLTAPDMEDNKPY